ncbi:hypothetical protein B0H14DRAFT_2747998 [Mycena olivaceomarginata]|nr:hypothetical protein B0H14DRAFT_2747998 [Mycena olivaceomarginata]
MPPAPTPAFNLPPMPYTYTESDDEPPSDLEGPELVEFYQAVATKLKAQRNEARSQREGADAHAVIAGLHIQSLQKKLNTKTKKRGGNARTLASSARILTSAEGRTLAEEKRNTQLRKKTKQDESKTQKLLASAEAPQLKDLAWSLALEEDGTREVLIARILECFATNNALKEDKRYIDLWTRRRRAALSGEEEQHEVLTDIQNVASGSFPMDVDRAPSPLPHLPVAPYMFPDSWTPPPSHTLFGNAVDHPPPFSPEFNDHPPSDFYSTRHPPNPYDLPYGPSPLHYQ